MDIQSIALVSEARKAAMSGRASELRREAQLSQAEVARAVGVTAAAVSRWESGQRSPSGDLAVRYAELLRVIERAA
jgi:transcriptional regulator with XRE-family HTH domain